MCVRINDDHFIDLLYEQITNIYDYVDEILIHYNGLNDETKLLEKFFSFKKCFLKGYSTQNFNFEKYTNDFIDEMHYKWFFLFDSDIVFDKQDLINFLSQIRNSKNNIMFIFAGINILRDKNNNIGFSDGSAKITCPPFVGVGDFLCYVPIYNAIKKRYRYQSNSKAKNGINMDLYSVINVGIKFLHFSFLRHRNEIIKNYFSLKEIEKNVLTNTTLDQYHKSCYLYVSQNSNLKEIERLLKIKKEMNKFIVWLCENN